jgi:cytochrome c553
MPPIVEHGRKPSVFACAYCHLPDGRGRPENAALAGLPSAYIQKQVADINSGARRPAIASASPSFDFMHTVATNATTAEIDAAARYFSALPYTEPRTKVVESDSAPALRQLNGVYVIAGPNTELLGQRLLDAATDGERHELHDPDVAYVTYAPRGSLTRGRVLATTVTPTLSTPCVSCHGADLRGVDTIPPIAGRPPSYLLRQLFAFRAGTRAGLRTQLMQGVVSRLNVDDMIAVAAYVGSVKP